jgi:hypothetical protein
VVQEKQKFIDSEAFIWFFFLYATEVFVISFTMSERLSSTPPSYAVRFASELEKPLYLDGVHPNVGRNDHESISVGAAEFFHGVPATSQCVITLWAKGDDPALHQRRQYHPGWARYAGETSVLSLGGRGGKKEANTGNKNNTISSSQPVRITYVPDKDRWKVYIGSSLAVQSQSSPVDDAVQHNNEWMHIAVCISPQSVGIHRNGDMQGSYADLSYREERKKTVFTVLGDHDPKSDPSSSTEATTVPSFAGHYEIEEPEHLGHQRPKGMPPFPGSLGDVRIYTTKGQGQTDSAMHLTYGDVEKQLIEPTVQWDFSTILDAAYPEKQVELKEPHSWLYLEERERALLQGKNPNKELASPPSPLIRDPLSSPSSCQSGEAKEDSSNPCPSAEDLVPNAEHRKTMFGTDKDTDEQLPTARQLGASGVCNEDTSAAKFDALKAGRMDARHEKELRNASPRKFAETETAFKNHKPCDSLDNRGNDWSPFRLAPEKRHQFLQTYKDLEQDTGPQANRHLADITRTPKLRTRLQSSPHCLHPNMRQGVQADQDARIRAIEHEEKKNKTKNGDTITSTSANNEEKKYHDNSVCAKSVTSDQLAKENEDYEAKGHEIRDQAHTAPVYKGTKATAAWTLTPTTQRLFFPPNMSTSQLLGEEETLGSHRHWLSILAMMKQDRDTWRHDLLRVHPLDSGKDDITRRVLRRAAQNHRLQTTHPRLHHRVQQLVRLEDKYIKENGTPPTDPNSLKAQRYSLESVHGDYKDTIHGVKGASRIVSDHSRKNSMSIQEPSGATTCEKGGEVTPGVIVVAVLAIGTAVGILVWSYKKKKHDATEKTKESTPVMLQNSTGGRTKVGL